MKPIIALTPVGQLEYLIWGRGPVVLILHGTSGSCLTTKWATPLIDNGATILAPSRPGYGKTPLSVGRTAIQAAEAMIGLIDWVGVEQCVVVAISGAGPTGIALAAGYPERVRGLVLLSAVTNPANRQSEPDYPSQRAFYGLWHPLIWSMLRVISYLSPPLIARQTLKIFSTHRSEETYHTLSEQDMQTICRFYQLPSSRSGALNDAAHQVNCADWKRIRTQTLVIHSREDRAVPFGHAQWALQQLPGAQLHEAGPIGHFCWVGSRSTDMRARLAQFLNQCQESTLMTQA